MLTLTTKYCGTLWCEASSVFRFENGLPAFENERDFVPIEVPHNHPIILLQSVLTPDLCFVALPVQVVDPVYRMGVAADDLEFIGLSAARQPKIGSEVLALALLSIHEGEPVTANLMAPVVVNLVTQQAVQAIRQDHRYSPHHPLDRTPRVDTSPPEEPC